MDRDFETIHKHFLETKKRLYQINEEKRVLERELKNITIELQNSSII